MIIFRKSDNQHLILHDLLSHLKRYLSQSEEEVVMRSYPKLLDPKVDSWLVTELPRELEEIRGRQ